MTIAPPELIALSGYAGAGKDTVATILATCAWRRASFADPLREALYRLNPTADLWLNRSVRDLVDDHGWDKAKRDYPMIRRLLQRLGTEVGRDMFGDTFWVDLAMRTPLADGGRHVFTDCRFVNEADAIRNNGGKVWRITRPGFEAVNDHPSETALDDYPFDVTITNSAGLDYLERDVMRALTTATRLPTNPVDRALPPDGYMVTDVGQSTYRYRGDLRD